MQLYSILVIFHLLGLAIGAGGAFTTDIHVLFTFRKGVLTREAYTFLHRAGLIVFFGLSISLLSGFGLFLQAPDFYLTSTPFLTKMLFVLIVLLNGIAIHTMALPVMKAHIGKEPLQEASFRKRVPVLTLLSSISTVTWLSIIVLGATLGTDVLFWQMMAIYLAAIVAMYSVSYAGFRFMKS